MIYIKLFALGVTLACARCHDHKFDPIRQSDYYRIQAYFAATHENDVIKATPEEQVAWKARAEPIEREMKQVNEEMKKLRGKDDPATIDQKQALMKKLEKLQEGMPEPLPALHSVANMTEKNRRSICSRAVITRPKAIASACARSERCSPTARPNSPKTQRSPAPSWPNGSLTRTTRSPRA